MTAKAFARTKHGREKAHELVGFVVVVGEGKLHIAYCQIYFWMRAMTWKVVGSSKFVKSSE